MDGIWRIRPRAVASSGIFVWESIAQGSGERKYLSGGLVAKPQYGVWGFQKLKQFADVVYRFWLQKRPKFENFAQFTSWFLTSMFHGGVQGAKRHVWGLSPLADAWRRCCARFATRLEGQKVIKSRSQGWATRYHQHKREKRATSMSISNFLKISFAWVSL